MYLLGQGTWLQSFSLVLLPKQGLPPLKGSGLVQGKSLKLVPLLQDLLQKLQSISSSRPPSTKIKSKHLFHKN